MMNSMLPMLMLDSNSTASDLMMLMMFQSQGDSPIAMEQMMPFLMLSDKSDSDNLLLMVMMNSMTGGLNEQEGFDSNFNLLLPLALEECAANDAVCEKKNKDMMILLMAMQSNAPSTTMGPDMMLPLLLMDDTSNNEDLIFFMMMSQNMPQCVQPRVEEETETVYRTWQINADGTKTLINSHSG